MGEGGFDHGISVNSGGLKRLRHLVDSLDGQAGLKLKYGHLSLLATKVD
jgi:hypothetical protein